jgi:nucleoside-diphosphate-sugar epimerase
VFPYGEKLPVSESDPLADMGDAVPNKMAQAIVESERLVFELHPNATILRYPYVYGPYSPLSREWNIIRRIRDGRPYILVADGGRNIFHHGYSENMGHAVLLAIDNPNVSSGEIYNCGDATQLSLAQVIELVSATMGREIEMVSVPQQVGVLTRPLFLMPHAEHNLLDTHKIRAQLGYQDVLPSVEGFARTTRWLLANQPAPGGTLELNGGDTFNYEAEDRFVKIYRDCMNRLAEFEWKEILVRHPYPHPKKPGLVDEKGR